MSTLELIFAERFNVPIMRPELIAVLIVPFLASEIGNTEASSDLPKPGEARLIHFEGALPKLKDQSVELQYAFDLAKEPHRLSVSLSSRVTKTLDAATFWTSMKEDS